MKPLYKRISTAEKKLDRLYQQKYVPLNPVCLVCGGRTSELHHYILKSQSTYLRYELPNLCPLCRSCHCRHHQAGDPTIVSTIVKKKGVEWEAWIQSHRHITVQRNLEYLNKLNQLINKLK